MQLKYNSEALVAVLNLVFRVFDCRTLNIQLHHPRLTISIRDPDSAEVSHTSSLSTTLTALVMQSWSSQAGQCIFCTFRSIVRSTSRQNGTQFFHNGAWLARHRPTERSKRSGDGIGGFRGFRPRYEDGRPTGSSALTNVARSLRLTECHGHANSH